MQQNAKLNRWTAGMLVLCICLFIDCASRPEGVTTTDTAGQPASVYPLDGPVVRFLLAGEWSEVLQRLQREGLEDGNPVTAILASKACMMLNRNTEKFQYLHSVTDIDDHRLYESWAQELVMRHPDNAIAIALAGYVKMRLSDGRVGLRELTEPIESGNEHVLLYLHRGMAQMLGPPWVARAALADLDRVVVMAPELSEGHRSRGYTLYALERYEEAVASYDRAIDVEPDLAFAHKEKGDCLINLGSSQNLGSFQEAIDCYTRAIELDSLYVFAYENRGDTYGRIEEFEKGLADFNRAIELEPDRAFPYFGRGLMCFFVERLDDALVALRKYLSFAPSSEYLSIEMAQKVIKTIEELETMGKRQRER